MGWELISTILAAALSAGAAIYAAWAAAKAKASEVEATRLRELEQRLSERKMEIYGRIMAALGNLLIPEEARRLAPKASKNKPGGDSLDSAIFDFMNDVVIYGSDDVLRAFTRFRLASDTNPPAPVIIRLVSDFMLAIRRDLDGGQSAVTGVELIGMRINGLYDEPKVIAALKEPFEVVCAQNEWTPPWERK